MRIGPMRHSIQILKKESTSNAFGEPVNDWIIQSKPRAEIRPRSGTRSFDGDQDVTAYRFTIRMRYRSIDYNARIYHPATNRTFEIESIEPPNVPNMMVVQVKEVQGNG